MGLAELSAPPPHISREEHTTLTSSTPQSFDDIPPVLRFHDEVEVILTPGAAVNLEGRIRGSLWVTEASLGFLPTDETRRPGFKLDYQSLTLHALTPATPDLEGHLYCQIDDGQANGTGAEDEDEDDYGEMRELRVFVGEGKLSPLFEALSDCSALHASLLPSGEPSSFPFFPPNEDGTFDDDEDDEEEDGEWEDGDMENGGRVHLVKGSGQILMSFADGSDDRGKQKGKDEKEVDQVERFLGLVDWGNVPKPPGWEEGDEDKLADAPGDGEVEDIGELAKRLGAVEVDVDPTESIKHS